MPGLQRRLQQGAELFRRNTCLAKNRAKRSSIQFRMVGDHYLRKRRFTPKNDVATVLPLKLKPEF